MASGSPASDLIYDLVSVQYHALKAAQVYDQYISDAQGNDDVASFFKQCQSEDAARAERCHDFLAKLAANGIG